jgi:DinB superfamily
MTLGPELEKIRRETEAASAQAQALCDGLSEQQLGWRPRPEAWSIAENLLHLDLTIRTCLPVLDRGIEEAREKQLRSSGPFRLGLMGKFYVWYVEPPPVLKLPSPKPLRPRLAGAAGDALPCFLRSQQAALERIEAADGIDLARARITSPFASFVRMSLFALLSVFTAHERRHLWQAAGVRRQLPGTVQPAG